MSAALLSLHMPLAVAVSPPPPTPPPTDYCDLLGKDDIQGKKTGFLAGNKVYYVGGTFLVWDLYENETIGLTHPFYHDLKSRGTGVASYDGVGTGNDFSGWEWYRGTKAAYGSILADGERWEKPAPTRMFWRPDKMVVEYELSSPNIHGTFPGWCLNWMEGSTNGTGLNKSFWVNLSEAACWDHCNADSKCQQAIYEEGADEIHSQCWLGLNVMPDKPTGNRAGCSPPSCTDRCFAQGKAVTPVNIREEKFISANDVVTTVIKSDRPVTLELTGNTFDGSTGGKVVELHGQCSGDTNSNTIHVIEGGTFKAQVAQAPDVFKDGPMMLDGMSAVLSVSRPMQNLIIRNVSSGVCGYNFTVPLDSDGVTVSWATSDNQSVALSAARQVMKKADQHLADKTATMNRLLNEVVPYFRCSDNDIVKIYYFLWSLYLMYFTKGDSGMQVEPHTQTAVNNFLGMHRYDAVFQILVGSWASPAEHAFYANGNVLSWAGTLPFRHKDQLPDNFGIEWSSGCYGPEAVGHVIGAWQIYEHSGNRTFLAKAYDLYKTLFWDGISDLSFGYGYDSALCLIKMANVLGFSNETSHWNTTFGLDNVDNWLSSQWESHTPSMFGDTTNGISWSNVAPSGISLFPRNWTVAMAERWLANAADGFYGEVPLTCLAKKDWPSQVDPDSPTYNFAVTPDANWYMLRGLYVHSVTDLANKLTLEHLKKYNMEWGIPVAPETRRMNFALHGDRACLADPKCFP